MRGNKTIDGYWLSGTLLGMLGNFMDKNLNVLTTFIFKLIIAAL